MEPSAQDVAAVAQAMGQPAPQAPQPVQQPVQQEPAQQQPAQPTPQAAPSQQQGDPFATLFTQPTEPAAPTAQPAQPTQQPTEVTPTQQPQQPVEPSQPAPQAQPQQPVQQPQAQPQAPQTQTYEQYLDSVLQGIPEPAAQPDPAQVNPDDPEAIKGFFNELVTTAVQQAESNLARKQAIQNSENKLWNQAFDKYGSLRTNTKLRDMVHAIRRAEFQKGNAITPTQAAETLLTALQGQYQQGVADNQVVTTIEQVQPNGGGSTTVPTTMDADKALLAVQTGGETALAQILDAQFKAQGQ